MDLVDAKQILNMMHENRAIAELWSSAKQMMVINSSNAYGLTCCEVAFEPDEDALRNCRAAGEPDVDGQIGREEAMYFVATEPNGREAHINSSDMDGRETVV